MAPSVQYRRKGGAITVAVFCGGPLHSPDALAQVRLDGSAKPRGACSSLVCFIYKG